MPSHWLLHIDASFMSLLDNDLTWQVFKDTPFPETLKEQVDKAWTINQSFGKLNEKYDWLSPMKAALPILTEIRQLVCAHLNRIVRYLQIDAELVQKLNVIPILSAEVADLVGKKLETLMPLLQTAQAEALAHFEYSIRLSLGLEVYAQYQTAYREWKEGTLSTRYLLERLSVLFSSRPGFVDAFSPFTDGFRVEYTSPQSSFIFHPSGLPQIFEF